MKTVYVMSGVPGSGKDALARASAYELIQTGNRVAIIDKENIEKLYSKHHDKYDEKEVKQQFYGKIKSLLDKDWDVIFIEDLNLTKESRKELLKNITKNWKVVCISLTTPLENCLRNNETRKNSDDYKIPSIIEMLYKQKTKPSYDEGWDGIWFMEPNGME